jgi:hypothetical protein
MLLLQHRVLTLEDESSACLSLSVLGEEQATLALRSHRNPSAELYEAMVNSPAQERVGEYSL